MNDIAITRTSRNLAPLDVLRNRWLLDDTFVRLEPRASRYLASHENPVRVVLQFIIAQLAAVLLNTYIQRGRERET